MTTSDLAKLMHEIKYYISYDTTDSDFAAIEELIDNALLQAEKAARNDALDEAMRYIDAMKERMEELK